MAEINSNELPSQDDGTTTSAAIFVEKAFEDLAALLEQKCKLSKSDCKEEPGSSPTVTMNVSNFLDYNEHFEDDKEINKFDDEQAEAELAKECPIPEPTPDLGLAPKNVEEKDEDDLTTNVLIDTLINENKGLQKRVRLTESTLEFVMSKLRQAVTYLMEQPDRTMYDKQAEVLKLQKEVGLQTMEKNVQEMDLRREVLELLLSASRIEDNMVQGYEELVTRLQLENQGLRKMLCIASEFRSPCLLITEEKSVQTEEEDLYEVSSENDGSYHTAISAYLGSDECADDNDNVEDNKDNFDNDSLSSSCGTVARNQNEEIGSS